jgi:hypothetical protein
METASRRLFLAALPAALVLGCKGGHKFSQADLDRARQALETSLDSWKKGERPEKLRALAEPILFAEEGPQNGLKLLDYQILGTEHTDAEVMRFSVKLTVQDRRGKREERQATYAVALKSPIAIGRDPYF